MLAGDLRKGKAMADTAIVANGLLVIRGGKILYAGKALKAPKFKAYETASLTSFSLKVKSPSFCVMKEPPSLTTTVSPKWSRLPKVCNS